jgi:hypothetical protein
MSLLPARSHTGCGPLELVSAALTPFCLGYFGTSTWKLCSPGCQLISCQHGPRDSITTYHTVSRVRLKLNLGLTRSAPLVSWSPFRSTHWGLVLVHLCKSFSFSLSRRSQTYTVASHPRYTSSVCLPFSTPDNRSEGTCLPTRVVAP